MMEVKYRKMMIVKHVRNFILHMGENRNFCDVAEISATRIYEIVEISAISQKFLFSHIQNKIPNNFCNHDFSISRLHHGDLLWGMGPSPADARKNCGNFSCLSWFSIFITARHMFHNHFGDSERVDNHSLQ